MISQVQNTKAEANILCMAPDGGATIIVQESGRILELSEVIIEGRSNLDYSRKFNVAFAVELPFWISIESGKYKLPNGRELNLRNDLWLLTLGNIVDDPPNNLGFLILNEQQIDDQVLHDRLIGTSTHYHKRKMKTTLTRPIEIIPIEGALIAQPSTEGWTHQLEKVLMNVIPFEKHQELLDDINSFLDYYVAIISPALSFGEVRRVSFYDVMLRIIINEEVSGTVHLYSLRQTPDIRMADIPYPPFRVRVKGQSQQFRDVVQTLKAPAFHQIQWAQTLNHMREGRLQEALLSCAIILEALAYRYWSEKAIKKKGMARWLRGLDHPHLQREFNTTADLWSLRNKVVHEQRVLTCENLEVIKAGIGALGRLRRFFLQKLDPEIVKMEHEFSSFLEPTYLIASKASVGKSVPVAIQWRREIDHYEKNTNRRT